MSRYDRFSYADMPEGAELARIQRGINDTMRAIVTDRYNPANSLPPSPTVTVVGATEAKTAFEPGGGRGWAEPRPITSPPGQEAIERLVNAALPPGPAQQLEGIRVTIGRMSPEQRAHASAWLAGRNDHPLCADVRAMLEEAEGPAKEAGR
jgi:hypothetical protein